jgi:hypothetical protein
MTTEAIKVFFCYADQDDSLRGELEKHLSPLRRVRYITGWFDRNIQAGTDWRQEIETRIDTANIILLLVSPDFIYSDYCYTFEMRQAIDRHKEGKAYVIPIILRPVHWQETPIGELQALPTGGKPISQWDNRDAAYLDVAQNIRQLIGKLLTKQILSKVETEVLYPGLAGQQPNIRLGSLYDHAATITSAYSHPNTPIILSYRLGTNYIPFRADTQLVYILMEIMMVEPEEQQQKISVAKNGLLLLRLVKGCTIKLASKVLPLVSSLDHCIDPSLRLSAAAPLDDIQRDEPQSILFAIALEPGGPRDSFWRIAQAELSYDLPEVNTRGERMREEILIVQMDAQQRSGIDKVVKHYIKKAFFVT